MADQPPTLKKQIEDNWDAFIERTNDMPTTDRITRLVDYTRAMTAALAEEIDKLHG